MDIVKSEIDIGLVAKDRNLTTNFYRDMLGLKQGKSIKLADGVIQDRLFIGRNTVKINSVPKVNEQMSGGMKNAIGIRLLALMFDDLDCVLKNFDKEKIKHSGIIDFPGAKLAFIKDPDGNLLEFIQPNVLMEHNDRIQIGLCVSDIEISRYFYGKVLGFSEEPTIDMGDGTLSYGFRGGDTLIKFWQGDSKLPVFSGKHFSKIGLRYYTYTVSDLDAVYQHLKTNDIVIMEEPFDVDGIAKVLLIADPDDNCIEFVQYY
jgi:catechol 2,3-dioxygenase-like lactoylglutathione lyase family enzyme